MIDLPAVRSWLALGLAATSLGIGLAAASRLAQYERIIERHCGTMWARWQREDDIEHREAAYRRLGMCPAGCGPLIEGRCERCGFR